MAAQVSGLCSRLLLQTQRQLKRLCQSPYPVRAQLVHLASNAEFVGLSLVILVLSDL